MRVTRYLLTALAAVLTTASAAAHHPGQDLEVMMGSREKFFQAIDKEAPPFTLRDAEGREVGLADFKGSVVVLHFIYATCRDVCPLHADRIADVQAKVNQSAMKDRVRFITITTDPVNDTAEVLRNYGPAHGLDAANWTFLTTKADQAEDSTRELAKAFGHTFTKTADGSQVHGIVTHVIDKDGRWRANFHGLQFEPVNLVLYLNALANEVQRPAAPEKKGLWERLRGLLF